MAATSIVANTGRRTQSSASFCMGRWLGGRPADGDDGAVVQVGQGARRDALALGDALYQARGVGGRAGGKLHDAQVGTILRVDDEDAERVGVDVLDDGGARHEERTFSAPLVDRGNREHARLE